MTDKELTIQNKVFLKSKTLWGVVIGIVPLMAAAFGMEPPDLSGLSQAGLNFINTFNELVGFVLILWGRWAAPGVRLTLS